jgi:hypothetical protein
MQPVSQPPLSGFIGKAGRKPALFRKKICGHMGFSSEQDVGASGFSWVAREPQLIVGAKGRTSSQRSLEYHKLSGRLQHALPQYKMSLKPGTGRLFALRDLARQSPLFLPIECGARGEAV